MVFDVLVQLRIATGLEGSICEPALQSFVLDEKVPSLADKAAIRRASNVR
jgi:hypothetical protein